MIATDEEVRAFLIAREATRRGALGRWLRARGVNMDDITAVDAAEAEWLHTSFLGAPALRALSLRALESVRGAPVTADTPLRLTLWRGMFAVEDGEYVDTSVGEFAAWLLQQAQHVAAKGCGWVACPVRNSDGRRVNSSTQTMTAVSLDNDARGRWDRIIEVLTRLGIGFVIYESGGASPTKPKWHLLLFITQEFDTSDDANRSKWKSIYHHLRVAVGSVAELLGDGFDPACETPCQPVFVTERRSAQDPPRQVIFQPGHALDLTALALALPVIEESEPRRERGASGPAEMESLDDERLESIVAALANVTANVPADRRLLYLSLSGALLDRNVAPDDVLVIVEAVSERYPRGDEKKHRDNVRIARCTVAKFENGGVYSRIGTLNASFPDVAAVVDDLLPDAFTLAVNRLLDRRTSPEPTAPTSPSSSVPATTPVRTPALVGAEAPTAPRLTAKKARALLLRLRRQKRKTIERFERKPPITEKQHLAHAWAKYHEVLLTRLLAGTFLDDRAQDGEITGATPQGAVEAAVELVGHSVPVGTELAGALLDAVGRSITYTTGYTTPAQVAFVERAYRAGMASRLEWNASVDHQKENIHADRARRMWGSRTRRR